MRLLSVFSKDKSFDLPLIGSPLLNKLGLHVFRIRLADAFLKLRRLQVSGFTRPTEYERFKKDGILVLEKFLPDDEFQALLTEMTGIIQAADSRSPIQSNDEKGFGQKHPFSWGFDRYDGGTLNRFYNIKDEHSSIHTFLNNPRLRKLTSLFAGTYHDISKYQVYKLFHGKEEQNSDIQKAIHRDTFHSSIKLWYFVEDVNPEHGPFHYAAGTHKMTKNRLQWEKQRSIQTSEENTGGSFRISEDELSTINDGELKSYPVKANTLVIADIRGFHCRGRALEKQERISIYANIRPSPYLFAFHSGKLKELGKRLMGQ